MAEPRVSCKPQLNEAPEHRDMMQIPDIFPACTATQAMASNITTL